MPSLPPSWSTHRLLRVLLRSNQSSLKQSATHRIHSFQRLTTSISIPPRSPVVSERCRLIQATLPTLARASPPSTSVPAARPALVRPPAREPSRSLVLCRHLVVISLIRSPQLRYRSCRYSQTSSFRQHCSFSYIRVVEDIDATTKIKTTFDTTVRCSGALIKSWRSGSTSLRLTGSSRIPSMLDHRHQQHQHYQHQH